MSGNPFAPGSNVQPLSGGGPVTNQSASPLAGADPFKPMSQGNPDPFSASTFAAPAPLSRPGLAKEASLKFPDTPKGTEDYSFAELNPTQYGRPTATPRRTTEDSSVSLNSIRPEPSFPVGFPSNDAQASQQTDKYTQHPQNPLYQGPPGSASFQNTPRLPQPSANAPSASSYYSSGPGFPSQSSGQAAPQAAGPSFQGYHFGTSSLQSGAQNGATKAGQVSGPQAADSSPQEGQDPFAGLSGLKSKQPRHAESLPTYAQGAQLTSLSNPNTWAPSQPSAAPKGPTTIAPGQQKFGSAYSASQPNSARVGSLSDDWATSGFGSHQQGAGGDTGYGGAADVKGNALTRPFYPAGDLRTSQQIETDPSTDRELWNFAQLDVLKARRESIELESKKEAQKPMRPSNGAWAQQWASFDEPSGFAQGGQQPVNSAQEHAVFPSQQAPHQPASAQAATNPASIPEYDPLDDLLAPVHPNSRPSSAGHGPSSGQSQPASRPQSAGVPAPASQAQPAAMAQPVVRQPAANQQSSGARVPWALAPPSNDPLRPRTQGQGAYEHGAHNATAQLPGHMNALNLGNSASSNQAVSGGYGASNKAAAPASNVPEAWKSLSESDAALARKLQEEWDREEKEGSNQIVRNPLNRITKRSAVAGRPPTQDEIEEHRRKTNELNRTGQSEVQDRAKAFLARVGTSTNEDEELARKLQAEYDAEHSNANRKKGYSQGAYAMETRHQQPVTNSFKPQTSIQDDEELANRLQQEEIRRSQAYSNGFNTAQPQFQGPPQPYGTYPTYPPPQQGFYPPAPAQGYYPQGYPQQPPNQGYNGHSQPFYPGPSHQQNYGQAYGAQSQYGAGQGQPGATQGAKLGGSGASQAAINHGYPSPPAWHARAPSSDQHTYQPQAQAQQIDTSKDAEMARRLQEEYEREAGGAIPQQSPAPQYLPSQNPGQKPAEPKKSGFQFWKRVDKLIAAPPESLCVGCKQPVTGFLGGQYLTVGGGKWHPECLKCAHCGEVIREAQFKSKDEQTFYHPSCYNEALGLKCCVCHEHLKEKNGRVTWSTDSFWKYKACEMHLTDGTSRCYACNQLQPIDEDWVPVSGPGEAERKLCLSCVGTVVVDTADVQPLYKEVQAFFVEKDMRLPILPPVLLVEPSALESAEQRENRHHALHKNSNAPVFHTRGLTLSMEYQEIKTVVKYRGFSRPETVRIPGIKHSEVTAILVLAGLPRQLCGSILAHECMHAWLRLNEISHLSRQVEEGLCQLMAYLWLQAQTSTTTQGSYEEKLQSYCEHAIRTEKSVDYGDGFRLALDGLSASNMPLVTFIRQCTSLNKFPIG